MKRSNLTKYLVIGIFGISIFCFMGAVQGTADYNTDIRPIEDFNNSPHVFAFGDPESLLVMIPHAWILTPETIWDCDYSGFIVEKDLKGPWVEFTIYLHVKGATCWVHYSGGEDPWPFTPPVFEGTMDYYFLNTFQVKQKFGNPLPTLADVWFGDGKKAIDLNGFLIGWGFGTFTEEGERLGYGVAGEETIASMYQVWYLNEEGEYIWPIETIGFI